MSASNLTIRMDNTLKEDAARVVEHYGLDLSSAVRAFLTQIVNTNSIPLSFDYERPNDETLAAFHETDEMIKTGKGKSYSSAHEMIEAAME